MTQLSDKAYVLPQNKQLISLNQLPAGKDRTVADRTEPNRKETIIGPKDRSRDHHDPCQIRGACQKRPQRLRQGMHRVVTLPPRARTSQVGGSVSPDRCSRRGAGLR